MIALGLGESGRQSGCAQGVVVGEGGGDGDAVAGGVGYDQAPGKLGVADFVCESWIGEEAGQGAAV